MRVPKLLRNPDGRAYATIPGSKGKRRKYFGTFGTKEADKAFREWLSLVVAMTPEAEPPPASDVTVSQLLKRYLEFAEGYYSPGELANIEAAVKHLGPYLTTRVAAFGPLALQAIQSSLVPHYRRGVINGRINRIKRAFRWGVSKELVPPSVIVSLSSVHGLKAGRTAAKESTKVKAVRWIDVAALLPHVSPVVRAMIQVQYLCGMRPGEVCAMRPADIDRTDDVWIYRPTAHKNLWRGKACVKAIPPVAQAILSPFLNRDPSAFCFNPREADAWSASLATKPDRKTPVYPSELKRRERQREEVSRRSPKHFTRVTFYRYVAYGFRRAAKAGVIIAPWYPHQLRHSVATEIDAVHGRQAAQHWLGHDKMDTTAIYTEHQVEHLITLARQIGPFLEGVIRRDGDPPPSA